MKAVSVPKRKAEPAAVGLIRVCTNNLGQPLKEEVRRKYQRKGEGVPFRHYSIQMQSKAIQLLATQEGIQVAKEVIVCCNAGITLSRAAALVKEHGRVPWLMMGPRILSPTNERKFLAVEGVLGRVLCYDLPGVADRVAYYEMCKEVERHKIRNWVQHYKLTDEVLKAGKE